MGNALRLLVVEDVQTDFLLLTMEIRKAGYELVTENVCTEKDLRKALAQEWDVVTTDHKMPSLSAPEVLSIVREHDPDLPIIVVSGEIDVPLAVSLLKSGANDYIHKSQLGLLPTAIEHELASLSQRRERLYAEEAMRTTEAILEAFLEASESLMGVVELRDNDAVFIFCNGTAAQMLGRSQEEMKGLSLRQVELPDEAVDDWIRRLRDETGQPVAINLDFEVQKDGESSWFQITANPIAAGDTEKPWYGFAAVNISRLKEAEAALRESENRYRGIVEDQTDLICRFLPDGTLTFVNEAYCNYFGKTREDLLGESFLDLVAEQDRSMVRANLADITAKSPVAVYDHRVIAADGSIRWQSWTDRGVFDEKERLVAFQSVGHDITDRKTLEQALRRTDSLWQSTFDALPYPVCILGADYTVARANTAMADFAELTVEECAGRMCYELIHRSSGPVPQCPHAKMISDGEPHSEEFLEPRLGKWLRISCSPLTDENGAIVASVHMAEDISERVEAFQRLTAMEKAQDGGDVAAKYAETMYLNHELESFSYSVSHDLRAPLRGIKGFADALWEDYAKDLPEEAQDYLSRIRRNSDKMTLLIEDTLSLSRVSRVRISPHETNLSGIVSRIAEQLDATDSARLVDWIIPDGVRAHCDAALLEVALSHLLNNAWKFTSTHPFARVEFGVTDVAGEAVFFVKDDGVGFDMAYADKLFTAFQRLHADGEFEGTGVGLAIVKRIIDRHGGRIWADAAVDKGATFYFTIPGTQRSWSKT